MSKDFDMDQLRVYRGVKKISEFIGASKDMTRKLINYYGLPVVRETDKVITLTNKDYLEWRENRRKVMEKRKKKKVTNMPSPFVKKSKP